MPSIAQNAPAKTDYATTLLKKWAARIVFSEAVTVPHDAEEMNWRLFFAHSQASEDFHADIFTGGPNEPDNPFYPGYKGLRDRWQGDSKSLIAGLAALWNQHTPRQQMLALTTGRPMGADKATRPMKDILRGEYGNEATRTFVQALDGMTGPHIASATRTMIRAYVQNAALLAQHDCSLLAYLQSVAPFDPPAGDLPAGDMTETEALWRTAIERDFYHVGPDHANYLIADWLLWLWREGNITYFSSYNADDVFLAALTTKGKLPKQAVLDFPAYCHILRLPPEAIPPAYIALADKPLPPRILNAAMKSKLE